MVHGHSRGGHGAWALATRIPDRVLGVASACGWYSREEYGDANNLWVPWTKIWGIYPQKILGIYPLVMTNSLLLKMAIEIVGIIHKKLGMECHHPN